MPVYSVEIRGEYHAYIEVEADSEEEAEAIGAERGCELYHVAELVSFDVHRAERVGP